MTKVTRVIYGAGACPYQLEAETEGGRKIYLRYRGGYLRWGFLDDKNRLVPAKYEFSQPIGDMYDGSPDDKLFKEALRGSLEFPDGFNFEKEIYEN